eukprot:TRINITY_DN61122_c0_g1_i1.p2 TRINITY_DN61122_c0_g1~~TRINITY_DN61122_c0_g1_i1.p2  ORF type:complete len:235 (+),score=36.10 TRINITY_DN61122_c0_g1_i1:89-793(+)
MRVALLVFAAGVQAALDPIHGGERYVTTHSFHDPIDRKQTDFQEKDIREWHFHVYFHLAGAADCPHCNDSYVSALRLHSGILNAVREHRFVAVTHGITAADFPGLDEKAVPGINTAPRGPHPCGSYEVWVPAEYLGDAMSWFMINRGELSILLHPLTEHPVEDHSGRAMWLGPQYRLNLNVLPPVGSTTPGGFGDPPQYPELGLGYSADPTSMCSPQKWWQVPGRDCRAPCSGS